MTPRLLAVRSAVVRRRAIPLVVALAAVVLALGGGVWLAVSHNTSSGSQSPGTVAGADLARRWHVATGSEAGYRVRARFVGRDTPVTVTGRTDRVSGGLLLTQSRQGLVVSRGAHFEIDMASLRSGNDERDRRLRTVGLETDRYPTATFVTSRSITLPPDVLSGRETRILAFGQLTLHGVTRAFALPVDARLRDDRIEISCELALVLGDFRIHPPDLPGFVTVDIHGSMQVHLVLRS